MTSKNWTRNRDVGVDSIKIASRHLLHVVDRGTKFRAATFLQRETIENVWESLLRCRVATKT